MTPEQITEELCVLAQVGVIPRLGGTATRGDVEQTGRIGEMVRALIEADLLHPPPDPDDELRALLRP